MWSTLKTSPTWRLFQEALEVGEAHNILFRVLRPDGADRHVQLDVLTRYDAQDVALHLRCHFLDVTDRVQTERELAGKRRRCPRLSFGSSGSIETWNG